MYYDLSSHLFDSCKKKDNIICIRQVGSNSTNQEGINYADNINEQFLHHNIYERSEDMLQQCKARKYDEQHLLDKLKKMNKFITITMLNAETQFCKNKRPCPVDTTSISIKSLCEILQYQTEIRVLLNIYTQD
jgi:hypothetical protein